MSTFKAKVSENAEANRLLSLTGGKGVPEISVTPAGSTPDFRSTSQLKSGQTITVTIANAPIWSVEAGQDLTAGAYVEVGEGGKIVAAAEGKGIGYVTDTVKAGKLAKLVRKTSGSGGVGPAGPKGDKGATGPAGPAGPKGDKGDPGATQFTAEEVAALKALAAGGGA